MKMRETSRGKDNKLTDNNNSIKSLAINLAGIKASAKDGSLSLNKTALTLQKVAGIDVFADKKKTQMKDMTVILDEVAQKWGTLNDKEKKGLSEALGNVAPYVEKSA